VNGRSIVTQQLSELLTDEPSRFTEHTLRDRETRLIAHDVHHKSMSTATTADRCALPRSTTSSFVS